MRKSFAALLALVMMGAVAAAGASAYPWNGMGGNAITNQDMQNALENNDYEAFKTAVSNQVSSEITEERFAQMVERYKNRQAINNALENGDYQAWKNAVNASMPPKITDVITQDNFDKYVTMHEAMVNGDTATAKEIADELGIGAGMGPGDGGFGRGGFGGHGRMRGIGGCQFNGSIAS